MTKISRDNLVKIELPNGNKYINPNLPIKRKKEIVEEILNSIIKLDNDNMTIDEYLKTTWEKQETKIIIGNLAYFITYTPQVQETPLNYNN